MCTDFSSIDRLVEFGMGLSLAQQMINTMNQCMNNMQVAGVNAGTTGQSQSVVMPKTGSRQWYAVVNDRQVGPLSEQEVSRLIGNNNIDDSTLMWCAGMSGWQMTCNIPEINKLFLLY